MITQHAEIPEAIRYRRVFEFTGFVADWTPQGQYVIYSDDQIMASWNNREGWIVVDHCPDTLTGDCRLNTVNRAIRVSA